MKIYTLEGCDKDGLTQCTPRLKYDEGKGGSLTVQSIPWHWTFLISMFVVGAGAVLITMSVACRSSAQAKHERSSPQKMHSVLSPRKTLLEPTPHPLSVAVTTSRGRLSVKAQRLSMIKSRKSTPKRGSALSHFAGHALSYRESTDSLPVQTPHTHNNIFTCAVRHRARDSRHGVRNS
ncbi:hypothetical protein EB796_025185 [Bugula neritina]|uniref:Uncharacterized protein n=1 Tax=Bugula neritina TaxID=10212 RepID=A0A7J7IRC9_BUGNE|nr:hypothetical protein EB796_025185 [Bugula neritina]